jgi:hypothetical protein
MESVLLIVVMTGAAGVAVGATRGLLGLVLHAMAQRDTRNVHPAATIAHATHRVVSPT